MAAVIRTPRPSVLARPLPSSVITCSRRLENSRYIPKAHLLIPTDAVKHNQAHEDTRGGATSKLYRGKRFCHIRNGLPVTLNQSRVFPRRLHIRIYIFVSAYFPVHAFATGLRNATSPANVRLVGLLCWFREVCHLGLTRHQAAQKGIQIPCGLDTPCKPDLTTKEKLELPCGSETPTRPCRPDAPAGVKLPMRK